MKLYCALILCLAAHTICAEEKRSVPQFTLTDGRVVQAMRLIRISTPGNTTYVITLADGRRMTFSDDDVSKIGEAEVPISSLPVSLNAEKKMPAPPIATAPLPDSAQVTQTDEPPVSNENPDDYPFVPYDYRPRNRNDTCRSGFHSRQLFPDPNHKPFCHCLTHLLNQVNRQADNPAQVAGNATTPSNNPSVRPAFQSPVNVGIASHARVNTATQAVATRSDIQCKTPNYSPPVSNSAPTTTRSTPTSSDHARSAFSSVRSFQSMTGNQPRNYP